MSYLVVKISQENGKFVATVYSKPTFRGVYTHFKTFLPSIHKCGIMYILVYRWFTL